MKTWIRKLGAWVYSLVPWLEQKRMCDNRILDFRKCIWRIYLFIYCTAESWASGRRCNNKNLHRNLFVWFVSKPDSVWTSSVRRCRSTFFKDMIRFFLNGTRVNYFSLFDRAPFFKFISAVFIWNNKLGSGFVNRKSTLNRDESFLGFFEFAFGIGFTRIRL